MTTVTPPTVQPTAQMVRSQAQHAAMVSDPCPGSHAWHKVMAGMADYLVCCVRSTGRSEPASKRQERGLGSRDQAREGMGALPRPPPLTIPVEGTVSLFVFLK